ncbi:hypothetical protein KC222_10200 [Cedecea davisae]|uniref:SGNH hydrolase-type esterase domain-containing protein n=1 Tax=Cedecea davisae TaxID=158484 RepID=A0ABS6DGP5_9ENTR|nr:phage tail fiber protein [Cedecea davisae]MBU4682386.1 hypothetical protein [Cedecea davisae]MBU4688424.1 hypothetical protein [Cedecea davisae]
MKSITNSEAANMSLPNQTPYNIYTANGMTTVFPYEFYIIGAGDIQVTLNGVVIESGYTVQGVGNVPGGDVTFLIPPSNGTTVMLERVIPTYRLTDYQDNGDLLADTVNKDFDRLWMAIQSAFIGLGLALRRPLFGGPFNAEGYRISNLGDPINDSDAVNKRWFLQQNQQNLSKTLRVPDGPITNLPGVAERKNKIVGMNNDGQPVMLLPESGSAADVMLELASSADGEGDALVSVKQPFAGSNSTTVHQKMREAVSINDGSSGGAEPDGVTDCYSALMGLYTAGCSVIRFPFIPGTASIYYFSYFDPDQIQGVTFDVDFGVKISVPNDWLAGKPSALNIRFSRSTQFIFRSLKTEYTATTGNKEAYSEKTTFLESPDFDRSVVSNINVLTDMTPIKISWPSSDSWSTESYNASDTDFGQFSVASGDNNFRISVIDVLPTDEISTTMYATNNPQVCAIVRHTGGYAGVFATTSQTGISIQGFEKKQGQAPTTFNITYPMLNEHLSYIPVNCEWKIRINNFTSFDVLLNGFVAASLTAQGFIIDAGFGGFFNSGTTNPAVRFLNPVKIKNNGYTRNSFMAVKVFGDSISSDRVDCWPHYLKKELEFAEGVRAWSIINKAIPGDTSSGQLAIMQADGVSDANVVVIAVGTNDAQGQLDLAQYKNNLTSMVNICQTGGKPVVLIKFGLWYPQALAGAGVGQNTANYEYAARYRSVVSRVAAEKKVKLVELTDCEGPLVAYYINPSLSINMVGQGDGVVHDSIHPTSMTTMLIARKIARAIMGIFVSERGMGIIGMGAIVAVNNWVVNINDRSVQMDVSDEGVVNLTGIIFKSTGSTTDGTVIMQVPKNMAPKRIIEIPVAAATAGVRLIISPAGAISIAGATTTTTYISVAGISWQL